MVSDRPNAPVSLSDELLRDRALLRDLQSRLRDLVRETGAEAAFLVDEEGHPFATVGHIEFELPHPLASLVERGAPDPLLGALVGESETEASSYLVERSGPRALLVLAHDRPSSKLHERLAAEAAEIAALLIPPPPPS